jgi:hypothetical protein
LRSQASFFSCSELYFNFAYSNIETNLPQDRGRD